MQPGAHWTTDTMDGSDLAPPTPGDHQRKRARHTSRTPSVSGSASGGASDLMTPSPSPARRRGCNCKKSGCLKLYCECFAANTRCGDRCQCMGCKNRDHNRLEIAHAMEAIEKRAHRSTKSPVAAARKLEILRASSTPQQHQHHHHQHHQLSTPTNVAAMDGATRLLMSAERLEEKTPRHAFSSTSSFSSSSFSSSEATMATGHPLMATPARTPTHDGHCICVAGMACNAASACHAAFGGCGRRCACHQQQTPMSHDKATRGCSCKKSNCLKLYCECLAAQRVCDSRCHCECCKNRAEHVDERERAISVILERNPMAFQPKVASGASQHLRGCNCRKSNCMKNYCECHQAGVPCTSRCACQSCRNTDEFVSAKKMLIFSGDLKVRKPSSSTTTTTTKNGTTNSPESGSGHTAGWGGKPPRQPLRRASMDSSSPPQVPPRFRTPKSSRGTTSGNALELLSRTAPPASLLQQQQQAAYSVLGHHNARLPLLTKRKLHTDDHDDHDHDGTVESTSNQEMGLNFQQRLDSVATTHPSSPLLPSVEDVLDAELDATRGDLPLSKLCRSLLNAAGSVDAAPTPHKPLPPQKPERSPRSPFYRKDPDAEDGSVLEAVKSQQSRDGDGADEDDGDSVMASPMGDDLLCEEAIETPTQPSAKPRDAPGTEEKRKQAERRLASLQERAVLQEFSVWLRNLTTSSH